MGKQKDRPQGSDFVEELQEIRCVAVFVGKGKLVGQMYERRQSEELGLQLAKAEAVHPFAGTEVDPWIAVASGT